jgi:hypothetical protein
LKRKKIKKDILDWSFRRLPLTWDQLDRLWIKK